MRVCSSYIFPEGGINQRADYLIILYHLIKLLACLQLIVTNGDETPPPTLLQTHIQTLIGLPSQPGMPPEGRTFFVLSGQAGGSPNIRQFKVRSLQPHIVQSNRFTSFSAFSSNSATHWGIFRREQVYLNGKRKLKKKKKYRHDLTLITPSLSSFRQSIRDSSLPTFILSEIPVFGIPFVPEANTVTEEENKGES